MRTDRVFVVIDIEHPYEEDYWKVGLPDFISIALSDPPINVKDLTTYNTIDAMLADRSDEVDMFSREAGQ